MNKASNRLVMTAGILCLLPSIGLAVGAGISSRNPAAATTGVTTRDGVTSGSMAGWCATTWPRADAPPGPIWANYAMDDVARTNATRATPGPS